MSSPILLDSGRKYQCTFSKNVAYQRRPNPAICYLPDVAERDLDKAHPLHPPLVQRWWRNSSMVSWRTSCDWVAASFATWSQPRHTTGCLLEEPYDWFRNIYSRRPLSYALRYSLKPGVVKTCCHIYTHCGHVA